MLESECKKWASTLNAKSYFICQDQALKKIIISIYWLFQPDFYSLFWGEHWIQDVCQLFFINFMLQGNLLMGFISWKMWPIKSTIFVRPSMLSRYILVPASFELFYWWWKCWNLWLWTLRITSSFALKSRLFCDVTGECINKAITDNFRM